MAAYSAVVSLEQLLSDQLSNFDLLPKKEVASLHGKISSLKSSLDTIFPAPIKYREEANGLATRIREKIFEAQDTIEFFIFSTQNHPPESPETSKNLLIFLEKIMAEIDPMAEEAKRLGNTIGKVKKDSHPVDESQTFKSSVSGQSDTIVGQEEYKEKIKKQLTAEITKREIIPICGMAGIGKTTLARSIYHDTTVKDQFMLRAWVTVSQDANVGDILAMLLKTLESSAQKAGEKVYQGPDEKLLVDLHKALYNNVYLVVIDDMWDKDILMKVLSALPDNENKSRVILTTRLQQVAEFVNKDSILKIEPLNEENSWKLLLIKTFGYYSSWVPTELENHGRKIAENCKGHPLLLTVIGGLLSQESKTESYWQIIVEDIKAATHNMELEESYFGVLGLSYDRLPCKLKGCFLYMAAFPEDSDIPVSKLIKLWVAEGFVTIQQPQLQLVERVGELTLAEPKLPPPLLAEKAAEKSLLDLINRNLVLIRTKRSNGGIKYCGMHDSLKDLAERESGKEMFFHSRKRVIQKPEANINSHRRVSVHKTILMCVEDVHTSTKKIEKARSLLYFGTHHHHPLLFNLTFDLLRVLDAYTIFFIQFPDEILKLLHLRYLSFAYNGKLPSKLSKLHKLQVLIVKREPKIIYLGASFLPDEIWNLKELRHLLITETELPLLSPTLPGSILLENLQTLLNVNAASCTEEVLGHMPNLTKLGMWIDEPEKLGFYLNKLDKLEIFKFIVLNPSPKKKIEFQPKLFFPDTVRKLYLSGCGLPWEDMKVIARLPNLEVLKLKELAFHGPEWRLTYKFRKLKFLLIEYLNLKRWGAKTSQFPRLEELIFRHCYELEGIPLDIGGLDCLKVIELVDCSRKAVQSAKEIKTQQQQVFNNERLQVRTYSSCE